MQKEPSNVKKCDAKKQPPKRRFRWRSSYRDQPYGGVTRITNVYRGGTMPSK